MVNIKCMSWVRVKNDELIYNICRDRFGIFGSKGWILSDSDINISIVLGHGGGGCPYKNQVRIGRWCVSVKGIPWSLPISLSTSYGYVVDTLKDIVEGIEEVVGSTDHSWAVYKISADIPFCKSINKLKINGEMFVDFSSSMFEKGLVEYEVKFSSSKDVVILVRKYDFKWIVTEDFGAELISYTDGLGVLGEELNRHATIVAKIARVIIEKSCDIINNVANFLIEYFSVRNLYP